MQWISLCFRFRDDGKVNKFVDKLLKLLAHHAKTENLKVQVCINGSVMSKILN